MRLSRQTIIALLVLCLSTALKADFYVAPDGNDSNPGTKDKPFATIEAARIALRQLKTNSALPDGGVTVYIRGGTYPITHPITFDEQDSGQPGKTIVFRACPGESVRLIGGAAIPPDTFHPIRDNSVRQRIIDPAARNKVIEADLKALGIPHIAKMQRHMDVAPSELFFDDQPMTIARWPNEGFAHIKKIIRKGSRPRGHMPDESPEYRQKGPIYTPGIFEYDGERPALWTQAESVWLQGYWSYDWFGECIPVGSIDIENNQITLADPAHYAIGDGHGNQGGRFYAMNLLEEIDQPGEYYMNDIYSDRLYFYPPADLTGKSIFVSLLDHPILSTQNASHLRFQGITFEVCRSLAVSLSGGEDVLIAGCTIRNVSGDGVKIDGGKHLALIGSDIFNIGRSGVILRGGDQKTLTRADNAVINCHVYHTSRLKTTVSAIDIGGVGNRVANNLVHDIPFSAILWDGNFVVIERNKIHHACCETDDFGAIASVPPYSCFGNIIRHNLIYNILGRPKNQTTCGAYMIQMNLPSSGQTFDGNILYNGGRPVMIATGGRDNTFVNNILIDGDIPINVPGPLRQVNWKQDYANMLDALKKDYNYTQPPWSDAFPQLAKYQDVDEIIIPRNTIIANNIFYKTGKMDLTGYSDSQPVDKIVKVENNYFADDDPFVDLPHMNFELKKELITASDHQTFSIKNIPGFKKIPFDKIGLFKDEYRQNILKE